MDNGSDNKQPSKAGHKLSFSSRFVTAPFLVLEEENQIALAGLRVTRLKKKKGFQVFNPKLLFEFS